MDTRMKVDGQDTGVRLDLDLNALFKFLIGAAIVGTVGFLVSSQVSANDKLNAMATQITVIQVKLEQAEKTNANFVTLDQVNARAKLRDLQFSNIEARINALEAKVATFQADKPR